MDNLIKGIEDNDMAIKIQTVASNIQDTFSHMQNLLISQLQHSNHLNHELKEFKLGIIDLVKGKLSPFLVKPESLQATLHDIQILLRKSILVLT